MTLSTTSAQPSRVHNRHRCQQLLAPSDSMIRMNSGCTFPAPPVPGSSYTRVWIQMLLLMPQKFNIPTLKIRPSIADAMEHDQTRSHRLKLRSGLLNAFDQPCLHASCPPHARHAASTPHAAMTVTMTPCTQERACKRWRGRDSFKSHS